MKKVLFLCVFVVCMHFAFCYTQDVHEFIAQQALGYYCELTSDPSLNDTSCGSPRERFIAGTKNEDESDWTYGCGEEGGFFVNVQGWQNNLEDALIGILSKKGIKQLATHTWNSDSSEPFQYSHRLDYVQIGNGESQTAVSLTIGPVPTALTKAEKTLFGISYQNDENTLFGTHIFSYNNPNLVVQLVDTTTGMVGEYQTFNDCEATESSYQFVYKIRYLDDFLINHNIVLLQTTPVLVHLSDTQFQMLRTSSENPEYEYLGRLCHLLMDMAVPSHAHQDGHGPTLSLPLEGIMNYDCDYYEGWNQIVGVDDETVLIDAGGYLHDLSNLLGVWTCNEVIDSYGLGIVPLPSTYEAQRFVYDLFFTVNQITQRFASEDVNGNMPCLFVRYPITDYPYIQSMCDQISVQCDINPALVNHECVHDDSFDTMGSIRNTCIPLAIRAVATLIDWWQNRYDPDWQQWGNNVKITGNVVCPGADYQNTTIKVRRIFPNIEDLYYETTLDNSGDFELTIPNPQNSYFELWTENALCHPIFKDWISIPGQSTPVYDPPITNLGTFNQELLDVTGLHVNQVNDYNAFHNIQAAVDYAIEHCITRITIESGTYTGSVGIHVPEASELSVLEIYGTPQQTIIKPNGNLFRNLSTSITSTLDRFEIKDIIFDGLSSTGQPIANCLGAIHLQGNINEAVIKNCTIKNYSGNCFDWDDEENGRAIRSDVPTLLTNCLIYNNKGIYETGQYPVGTQGIVAISGISTIENCQIFDNTAADAGAIYVQGNDATVRNCHIYNNHSVLQSPETPYPNSNIAPFSQTLAIKCVNASNVTISQNVFSNNGYSVDGITSGAVIGFFNTTPPSAYNLLQNNTFINDVHPDNSECINALRTDSFSKLNLTNNVFSKFSTAIEYDNPPVTYYTINNNLFWQNTNNFSGITYDTVTNPGNCLFEDPMLGADYLPRWDEDVISPCIDAGIGDADTDGTPPDIGAVRAVAHEYWEYSFTTQADLEKWYWVSYPVLNSVTVNEDYNALEASVFFKELLEVHTAIVDGIPVNIPTYLETIDWKEVSADNSIYWSEQLNNWTSNINTHIVSSPQGYKIKLLQRSPLVVTLKETGMRTPANTQFDIYGQNNGPNVENWLGYFKSEPAWPHEAFASIWDDINMIKTKNWCLLRANPVGDYWGMHGKVTPLKDGDMVIVTTNSNHTFQWSNANATPPDYKAPPEHFVFNEKPDYVPIYITMPDSLITNLKEVGLYLDGVCKGAVVVEKNLEQICAYLDLDDDLAHGLIEFIFYYNDDKSQIEERKTIRMNNSRFQARYANGNTGYPFYDISISKEDMENVAPLPLNLGQNYPNPFNPSTTISYQLPESGKVRLDVFNVRGQLVRTLIDSEMEAGEHRVVWNGADANGQSVGSGIYYYRLSSPSGTLSKRMLLMK